MAEERENILNESEQTIRRLTELSEFFEHPTLMKIRMQTQVIHKLFEENPDMDINKLELFHLQLTLTLIELLEKIKKNNERLVGMQQHEMDLNNEMIEKLRKALSEDTGFEAAVQQQSELMSRALRNIYIHIYNRSNEFPFTENINEFSVKYYQDHFHEVDPEVAQTLTQYNKEDVFRTSFVTVGKKLLLRLHARNFKVSFFEGVRFNNVLMGIYKIRGEEVYFLYLPAKNLFLECDISVFPYQEWGTRRKENTIRELMQKNAELERSIKKNHKYIDSKVSALLQENYNKITDSDFLDYMESIDVHANILKTMLNTDIL
jgi:hypothetical protein